MTSQSEPRRSKRCPCGEVHDTTLADRLFPPHPEDGPLPVEVERLRAVAALPVTARVRTFQPPPALRGITRQLQLLRWRRP